MKHIAFAAVAAGLSLSAHADELPLKRVVLSTAGLAQFTHQGEVKPGMTIELPVRLDQVDDLLKSLTIFDQEGAIGAVSLPGKAPLAELFRDLPFGPEALDSPAALLNALVGAEVEIEGQVNAKGRIFRVEEETAQLADNRGQVTRHRLTLLTDRGLVQAVIEELSALRFTEPLTKAQIGRALTGIAQNRAKERRTLSISLLGQGTREAGFSYVVAAPVWKTSYRLVLPKEGNRARLQGWGVIENLTGGDWKDVDLSLVSGNPVALRQPLYTAFYADRPEIPVSASVRLLPRQDDTGPAKPAPELPVLGFDGGRAKAAAARSLYNRLSPAAPPQAMAQNEANGPIGGAAGVSPPAPEELSGAATAAESEEAATQVIYRFPAKITLDAGSTMMVPFVDRDITATRTWLYQPETDARHPLAALRITNDGDSALPPGIVTAFDTGRDGLANFAGDARLPLLPKGSFKFVTFALDSKTAIRRDDRGIKKTTLGKAVNGVLTVTVESRREIDYEITAPADEDRDIVVDEPRDYGWSLLPGAQDVEETAGRVRVKVAAPKGQTTKAALIREHVDRETVSLTTLDPERLLATITGLENASQPLKDAVVKLNGLVGEITKSNARRRELEAERKKIGEDQERIRRNLASVGQGSDLGRRYIDTLRGQEDRLAAIAAEDKAIDAQIAANRKAAEELAKTLTL